MKLLLVTSSLDDGGAEKWMLDTISTMDKTDIYIDYYFWDDINKDTFIDAYKNLGVNLYFRKLKSSTPKILTLLKKDFSKFIKEHGPYDAVHINGTKIIYQMIIMRVSKTLKIPVRMVHSHSAESQNLKGLKKLFRHIVRKLTINASTIVGGCSELAIKAKYGNKITNSPKYYIFKNGIDYKKFSYNEETRNSLRNELQLNDSPVYLHIGRFSKEKNHIFIVNVFKEILKLQPNAKLLLIGQGPLEKEVFNYINKQNINDKVIQIPYTDETEKYYSLADMVIFPSLYEGLPIVLLEAQASGIPCIISDTISNEVIINDNIKRKSLDDSYSAWANYCIENYQKKCNNAQNNILNAGFDLKITSQNFLRCCKNER